MSELQVVIELVKSFGVLPAVIIVLIYVLLRLLKVFEEKLGQQSSAIRELAGELRDVVAELRGVSAKLDALISFLSRVHNDEEWRRRRT